MKVKWGASLCMVLEDPGYAAVQSCQLSAASFPYEQLDPIICGGNKEPCKESQNGLVSHMYCYERINEASDVNLRVKESSPDASYSIRTQ